MFWPCETRTSTCRNFATISSGLYRFLAITVLLDAAKDIPQVGPLQWGRITMRSRTGKRATRLKKLTRLHRPKKEARSEKEIRRLRRYRRRRLAAMRGN